MNKDDIIEETASCVSWWIESRKTKLKKELSDTMTINPFMLPIVFELHDISDFSGLIDLLVSSHLMVGHNTGFGKLIDEKILPRVFKAEKLTKKYRSSTPNLNRSSFNEIDHIIHRDSGESELLCLKAGRWTIQLTMAQQLNRAFHEILENFGDSYSKIVVGVFYGNSETLTDKYDILRGINRGAKHDVVDLTDRVSVYAGRDFWSWLNNGVEETQDWVLEGIKKGISRSNPREESGRLLTSFNTSVASSYQKYMQSDGSVNWEELLKDING